MRFILNENFVLTTSLTKPEVAAALNGLFQKNASAGTYRGHVIGNQFSMTRIITHRNSFLPKITGEIIGKNHGTDVDVTMKPLKAVSVFMLIWLGAAALIAVGTTVVYLAGGEMTLFSCAVPAVMFVFGFAMSNIGFSAEVSKSKKDLVEALQATEKK